MGSQESNLTVTSNLSIRPRRIDPSQDDHNSIQLRSGTKYLDTQTRTEIDFENSQESDTENTEPRIPESDKFEEDSERKQFHSMQLRSASRSIRKDNDDFEIASISTQGLLNELQMESSEEQSGNLRDMLASDSEIDENQAQQDTQYCFICNLQWSGMLPGEKAAHLRNSHPQEALLPLAERLYSLRIKICSQCSQPRPMNNNGDTHSHQPCTQRNQPVHEEKRSSEDFQIREPSFWPEGCQRPPRIRGFKWPEQLQRPSPLNHSHPGS